MNGFSGPPGLWQEARNTDGRVYYYNTQTKATQWTKPLDLMSPAERAVSNQPWKEYTAEGGRKYWYNTETKASTWEMPEAYRQALDQTPNSATLPPKPATPSSAQFGGSYNSLARLEDFPDRNDRGYGDRDGPPVSRGPTFQKSGPEYNTYEEAEAAFFKMLRRQAVGSDWTWEQTVKATVKDPQYQAVKDPRDRKAAFEKYITDLRIAEKDKAKERLEKLRADFAKMLRSHSEIQHYTRWKTARPIIEREAIFRSTDDDDERRALFEEYISELRRKNAEKEVAARKSALDELSGILSGLNLEPYTRWSEANEKIRAHPLFTGDDRFQHLTRSDVLTAFENHIKALERSFNDTRQREKASRIRVERKRRDGFIDLLRELRVQGDINAGTKWSSILPKIKEDSRYEALLGQPGSTPLDLFRDMIEEEERALRVLRNDAYDVLEDRRSEVTPQTSLAEFERVLADDRRTRSMPAAARRLIFTRLQDKATRRADDDRHAADRAQRRQVDALRSRIKRLDSPPVRADSSYASFRDRLERLEEFRALDSEDLRRQAFEKVTRRLRDKEEDLERDRGSSRRDSAGRGDSGRRGAPASTSSGKAGRRPSHSPEREIDAYEADRRKAVADRERQYRRAGPASRDLSPPPSAGSGRERRSGDPRRLREYDDMDDDGLRERDRERGSARSRGGARDELNYDEDGPKGRDRERDGERRRRRGSSEESYGSVRKRAKRDREDEKRKEREKEKEKEREAEAERQKEEIAMRSGSEEGEMVEE